MGLKSLGKKLGFHVLKYDPITYEGQPGVLLAAPDDNAVTILLDGETKRKVVPVSKVWFGAADSRRGSVWKSAAGSF